MVNIEEIIENMCDHYCKYPEQWTETETIELWSGEECVESITRRMPLEDSDICRYCPLNRLKGEEND